MSSRMSTREAKGRDFWNKMRNVADALTIDGDARWGTRGCTRTRSKDAGDRVFFRTLAPPGKRTMARRTGRTPAWARLALTLVVVLLLTHTPVVEGARFIESLRKPISWAFLAKFCFLPAENNGIANKVQGMMYTAVKVRLDSRSRRQSCLTVPHGRKTDTRTNHPPTHRTSYPSRAVQSQLGVYAAALQPVRAHGKRLGGQRESARGMGRGVQRRHHVPGTHQEQDGASLPTRGARASGGHAGQRPQAPGVIRWLLLLLGRAVGRGDRALRSRRRRRSPLHAGAARVQRPFIITFRRPT